MSDRSAADLVRDARTIAEIFSISAEGLSLTISEVSGIRALADLAEALAAEVERLTREGDVARVLAQDLIAGVCRLHDADPRYDHGCEACDGKVHRENVAHERDAALAALAEAEERGADWGIKAVAAVVDPILGFHQIRNGTLIPGLPVVAAEVCRAARERGDY